LQTVEVTILGRRIRIRSDDDDDYIREVADYVNERMEEVQKATQTTASMNVAILVAMNIADDLFKAQGRNRTLSKEISLQVEQIISYIDEKLGEKQEASG
jgi:cell division protein ZapA